MTKTLLDKTSWVIIQNNEAILLDNNNLLLSENDINRLTPHFIRHFQLGKYNGREYRCAEISVDNAILNGFNVTPLRSALLMLYPNEYSIAVKAYSVINWDKNHQFCGKCGARTIHQSNEFERTCSTCKINFYPRISPSIIVLIQKEDHVLMARSPHFSPGIYALIAGFVEAGERIEDTVKREVFEEVGLKIKNVSYFGSQPWPFPDSLMLAFTAEYESGDIVMNHEIEAADWYRYDNLPGRPSSPISISSVLLDSFINNCLEKYGKD